jgi:hypothetical protein
MGSNPILRDLPPQVLLKEVMKDAVHTRGRQPAASKSKVMKNTKLVAVAVVLLCCHWAIAQSSITIAKQPMNTTMSLGANAQFMVSVSSNPTNAPITFQWWFKDAALDAVANPSAATLRLSLTNVTFSEAGPYLVVVGDLSGSATSQVATLTVDPTFTKITKGPVVEDREPTVNAAWADYDNDGLLDLFVANGGWGTQGARHSLYRNLGNDQFLRVTNAITTRLSVSWNGLWGDYDNDGDLDLLVLHLDGKKNELFRNDGAGVFTPVDCAATALAKYYTDAAWVDHDGDGWLDLFVANQKNGSGGPENDLFFHNQRDGTFAAWTTNEVGAVVADAAPTAGIAWCDLDNDGNLDLFVGKGLWVGQNYSGGSFLYRNDGTGQMVPATAGSLPGPAPVFGALWADFNNDGWFDLLTSSGGGPLRLHLNRGPWQFEDVTAASGLSFTGYTFCPSAGDFDNDGDLDLYVADYDGQDILYVNHGDGTFSPVDVGSPLREGVADTPVWVDYNNDGFLDLFKACGDSSPAVNLLYRNSLPDAGNTNRWLKVQLRGTASNRSGFGARVCVRAMIGGREVRQVRQIMASCYGGSTRGGPLAHFGLGDAINIDVVRIEWPRGAVEEFVDVAANQILTIVEPSLRGAFGPDGLFHVTMTGNTNQTYQLDTSSDLLNWATLTNYAGLRSQRDDRGLRSCRGPSAAVLSPEVKPGECPGEPAGLVRRECRVSANARWFQFAAGGRTAGRSSDW